MSALCFQAKQREAISSTLAYSFMLGMWHYQYIKLNEHDLYNEIQDKEYTILKYVISADGI
jgi:hypothetical protein